MAPVSRYLHVARNVELPILGGRLLLGTNALASMGPACRMGNHGYIHLEPDSGGETHRLCAERAADGMVEAQLQHMSWGACLGSLTDTVALRRMVHCASPT